MQTYTNFLLVLIFLVSPIIIKKADFNFTLNYTPTLILTPMAPKTKTKKS